MENEPEYESRINLVVAFLVMALALLLLFFGTYILPRWQWSCTQFNYNMQQCILYQYTGG